MGAKGARAKTQGVTLDAGALIALDRGNARMIALIQQVLATRCCFHVPAGVVAQAWRDGARQATLARFLRAAQVEIEPLDEPLARACGVLCGASGTSDIVDASVVLTARGHGDVIVTSDPDDLRHIDPTAIVERI
jgi:hypothetical protein